MSPRLALALRLIIPAIWGGMIIAIDLIEAPLKFQAPGITIPLGLGIGRLVFTAMNIVEVVLLLVLVVALMRPMADRLERLLIGGVALIVVIKLAVLRPLLASRTDAVIAGTEAGGSSVHLFYIAADAVLAVLLVWFLVAQVKRIVPNELVERVAKRDAALR